ncbi:MAG: hypothetical protein IT443_02425 [Phycisphaeraceae bacterium]|nr:hypothetical protein [Phycisphaeraceae bacterium]
MAAWRRRWGGKVKNKAGFTVLNSGKRKSLIGNRFVLYLLSRIPCGVEIKCTQHRWGHVMAPDAADGDHSAFKTRHLAFLPSGGVCVGGAITFNWKSWERVARAADSASAW